ncbi:MAG: hypothetical protein ACKOL0_01805, partial [Solirubrobacterales bacterium]
YAPGARASSAPVNTAVPTVTGTAKVRETLTASPGSWSANPSPPSYAYQWERCTATVTTSTTAVLTGAEEARAPGA